MKEGKSSSLYDGVDLSTHLRRGIDYVNIFDRSMMDYSGTSERCPLVHPELGEFSFFLSYVCYVMWYSIVGRAEQIHPRLPSRYAKKGDTIML